MWRKGKYKLSPYFTYNFGWAIKSGTVIISFFLSIFFFLCVSLHEIRVYEVVAPINLLNPER